jgi:hypothetical protein
MKRYLVTCCRNVVTLAQEKGGKKNKKKMKRLSVG